MLLIVCSMWWMLRQGSFAVQENTRTSSACFVIGCIGCRGTAHPVQTVSDDYKAMYGLAPAYLSELCASSYVEGRTRSSACGDLVVQWRRTKFGGCAFVVAGTGCCAPFATLRPWTVSRRRWGHFSSLLTFNSPFLILMLLHPLYERLCTVPLNRLPCYGALEVIVTLLLLLLLGITSWW